MRVVVHVRDLILPVGTWKERVRMWWLAGKSQLRDKFAMRKLIKLDNMTVPYVSMSVWKGMLWSMAWTSISVFSLSISQ